MAFSFTGQRVADEGLVFERLIASGVYLVKNLQPSGSGAPDYFVAKDMGKLRRDTLEPSAASMNELRNHELGSPHPNILTLYRTFVHRNHLFLLLERGQTDLYDFVRRRGCTGNEPLIREIVLGIARGIEYLHSIGIFHRDIKLNNILVSPKDPAHVWIADFGVSVSGNKPTESRAGTAPYMCPQGFSQDPHSPALCDPWALGILLLNLVSDGFFPWRRADRRHSAYQSFRRDRLFLKTQFPQLSYAAVLLLNRVFDPDPLCRPGICEIIRKIQEMPSLLANPHDFLPLYATKGLRVPPLLIDRPATACNLRDRPDYVAGAEEKWHWNFTREEPEFFAEILGDVDYPVDENGVPYHPVPDPTPWIHDETEDAQKGRAVPLVTGVMETLTSLLRWSAALASGSGEIVAQTIDPQLLARGWRPIEETPSSTSVPTPGSTTSAALSSRPHWAPMVAGSYVVDGGPEEAQDARESDDVDIRREVTDANRLPHITLAFHRYATKLRRSRSIDSLADTRREWQTSAKGKGKAAATPPLVVGSPDGGHYDPNDIDARKKQHLFDIKKRFDARVCPPPVILHWGSPFLFAHYIMPPSVLPYRYSDRSGINFTNLASDSPRYKILIPETTVRRLHVQKARPRIKFNPLVEVYREIVLGHDPLEEYAVQRDSDDEDSEEDDSEDGAAIASGNRA